MKVIRFLLDHPIKWLLGTNDIEMVELKSIPGLKLLNPFMYTNPKDFFASVNAKVIGATNELVFEVSDAENMLSAEEYLSKVTNFLDRIRYTSWQPGIPTQFKFLFPLQDNAMDMQAYPLESKSLSGHLPRRYYADTAITMDLIVEADILGLDFKIPIYQTLLLEAISFAEGGVFSKAILFAAIALESMASSRLETAFEACRLMNPFPPHMRLVTVNLSGGKTDVCDPVYSKLLDGREDFSQLLHIRPLYVLRQSLKVDNEPLFQDALTLYRTRNKLAHKGDLPDGVKGVLFPLTPMGCRKALNTALKVFEWFGEKPKIIAPFESSLKITALKQYE